jgi:hypothetical protein
MARIWKFEVSITDEFTLDLPYGAVILTVQTQRDTPCVWVAVDPEAPFVTRTFRIFGTGHSFDPDYLRYIGTFQTFDGILVWHLFEYDNMIGRPRSRLEDLL